MGAPFLYVPLSECQAPGLTYGSSSLGDQLLTALVFAANVDSTAVAEEGDDRED